MSTTVKRVAIKTQADLGKLLREHFVALDAASRDPSRRVAWCTSVGPCEILTAMGFDVYFPENHGALLGARRLSQEFIPKAVSAGYCAECCSYMNSDIGSTIAGESPLRDAFGIAGPPKPDLLVYSTNQCREVQDWFGFHAKREDVPVMGVCPPTHLGPVTADQVHFTRGLLERLIEKIEDQFRIELDRDRLREVVGLSSQASALWGRVLDTARARPAPLSFFDGAIHMAPVILMRGEQKAIDYYEALLSELEARIDQGVGAVPDEAFRVYWEGMPIWPKLREMSEQFFDLKTAVAASTYCNSWAFEQYQRGDPLDWMAKTSIEIFINRDEVTKQAFLEAMFDRFKVDGAIFHNARTCPNNTNSRFGMAQRLREQRNIPILVIDGDLADVRFFSTAQTLTNLEAFVEQLEEHKR